MVDSTQGSNDPMLIDLSADDIELITVALKIVHRVNSQHAEHGAEAYEALQLINRLMSPASSDLPQQNQLPKPNR